MITEELIFKFFMERFEDERPPIFKEIEHIWKDQWCLVGGTVRDLFFGYEPNDYDIIVKGENDPQEALKNYIDYNNLNGSINNFGGLQLKSNERGLAVDIWKLCNTWGIREGYVENRGFKSYCECCAYTTDAGYIQPNKEKYSLNYMVESINNNEVGLLFDVSPIPLRTVVKAYRLKQKYNLSFSSDVKSFISRVQ